MATVMQLRPVIQTKLRTLADRVFYEKTEGAPAFPYVVYSLKTYNYGEVINQAELEVNIYDNAEDTTALETLADNVWTAFDHDYYIDTNLSYASYPSVRNNIDVSDSNKQRRILITLRIC